MRQDGSRRIVASFPGSRLGWNAAVILVLASGLGCTSSLIRSKSEEPTTASVDESDEIRLVRDVARVWGMRSTKIEGIGLVSQLANTGSDPPTSAARDLMLDDMRRREVSKPTAILASPSTSLVIVRALLPPGVRKGDRIDVELLTPTTSKTQSLRHGWLMPTRLQEMAMLGSRLRKGRLMGMADGAVLVDSLLENNADPRFETKGRALGGATANVSRSLGLVLTTEHHSVRASARVGSAINARFHTYDRGTKRGVATPKRDNFIELSIHRSYRNNLNRYARVIQAIPMRETPREQMARIGDLELQLLDRKSALAAAVDLEAIGAEALPALRKGLESDSPLVKFAAAESLAYMNEVDAVPVLLASATNEPAFRWHALTALSAMTQSESRDALAQLMQTPSDESRYGAFQALVDFNPRDPAVRGETLGNVMTLHHIPSDSESLVHIRRTKRPEVVLFGHQFQLQTPLMLVAGDRILVKSEGDKRLKVSRFSVGADARSQFCSNDLAELIRTIIKVDGSYTDVVAAINDAKQKGSLVARVKYDALPKPGREYRLSDAELVPEAEERAVNERSETASDEAADLTE